MASASGVPADRQRLIFRGRVLLSDAEKLRDVAGFRDGDALHMVASSSAPPSARDGNATETGRNAGGEVGSISGSISLPAHALGSLDGVLDALLAESARRLETSASSPASASFAATTASGSERRFPNASGAGDGRPGASGAAEAARASAYADPTAAAARHAAFVRATARELAADPHGTSRGDGDAARASDARDAREAPTTDGADARTDASTSTRCTHFGVQCDACGVVPIVGVRYKSASRADYDLCETCHGAGRAAGAAPPEGPFAALRSPLPGLVPPPTAAPAGLDRADASLRRRAPPVLTTGALASALGEAARAARETAPALEAAAASLLETSASAPLDADRLHEIQGQTLRASMAAHGAGSLLMEIARLASSVHVAGGAAAAPEFLHRLARGGGGGDARAGTETRGDARPTAFLAPPLVYLDPRGGTQPLGGMGPRPNLVSGAYGGAPIGVHPAPRGAGATPPGAPTPRAAPDASAAAAGPGPGPGPAAAFEAAMRRVTSEHSRRVAEMGHRLAATLRGDISAMRREIRADVLAGRGGANGRRPTRALRGGLAAVGRAARFALRPFLAFRRRASARNATNDETRDSTGDVLERASDGPGIAPDAPRGRRPASSPAAGPGSPSAAAASAPPGSGNAAAPASAQPQRSTFNFRFESNVRVAGNPQGEPAAQARAARPQQAQASTEASQAQARARAAAAAQAAAAASFQQGIGALLNHLQQGGNVAPGARMRLVPTAEGGFTLEPAGAAEAPEGATAAATATATAPGDPATPASAPAPTTSDPEPDPMSFAAAVPRAAPPEAPPSGRVIDSSGADVSDVSATAAPREASISASGASGASGPRGVGSGLPPRAERAPRPRPSELSRLPRQDSLD